jgi:hypothetical protein
MNKSLFPQEYDTQILYKHYKHKAALIFFVTKVLSELK